MAGNPPPRQETFGTHPSRQNKRHENNPMHSDSTSAKAVVSAINTSDITTVTAGSSSQVKNPRHNLQTVVVTKEAKESTHHDQERRMNLTDDARQQAMQPDNKIQEAREVTQLDMTPEQAANVLLGTVAAEKRSTEAKTAEYQLKVERLVAAKNKKIKELSGSLKAAQHSLNHHKGINESLEHKVRKMQNELDQLVKEKAGLEGKIVIQSQEMKNLESAHEQRSSAAMIELCELKRLVGKLNEDLKDKVGTLSEERDRALRAEEQCSSLSKTYEGLPSALEDGFSRLAQRMLTGVQDTLQSIVTQQRIKLEESMKELRDLLQAQTTDGLKWFKALDRVLETMSTKYAHDRCFVPADTLTYPRVKDHICSVKLDNTEIRDYMTTSNEALLSQLADISSGIHEQRSQCSRVAELLVSKAQLEKTLAEKDIEISESNHQRAVTLSQAGNMKDENDRLQADLQDLREQNLSAATANDDLVGKQQEIDTLRKAQNEDKRRAEASQDELRSKYESHLQQIQNEKFRVEQRLLSEQDRRDKAVEDNQNLLKTAESDQAKLNSIEEVQKRHQDEISTTQSQLEDALARKSEAESHCNTLQDEKTQLLKEHESRLDDLQKEIQSKDAERGTLCAELVELRSLVETLKRQQEAERNLSRIPAVQNNQVANDEGSRHTSTVADSCELQSPLKGGFMNRERRKVDRRTNKVILCGQQPSDNSAPDYGAVVRNSGTSVNSTCQRCR